MDIKTKYSHMLLIKDTTKTKSHRKIENNEMGKLIIPAILILYRIDLKYEIEKEDNCVKNSSLRRCNNHSPFVPNSMSLENMN